LSAPVSIVTLSGIVVLVGSVESAIGCLLAATPLSGVPAFLALTTWARL
jgi:hypothetical protein